MERERGGVGGKRWAESTCARVLKRCSLFHHLYGAVHGARVHHLLVEIKGCDYPRVPQQLACMSPGLVPAENMLQVALGDAVNQHLRAPNDGLEAPRPVGAMGDVGKTNIPSKGRQQRC